MKKILIGLVLFIIVFFALGFLLFYLPFTKIKTKGMVLLASAKEMKDVFKKNNIDLVNEKMAKFSNEYKDFEKEASAVYWAKFIPYVADFKNGVEAGRYMITAGQETIQAITPYADLIGFKKGTSSFSEKPADERLQTAVLTLDKVLGKLDVISDNIKNAEIRIMAIDPKRYPEKMGKTVVRAQIVNIKEQFVGLASMFVDAKPLLKNIPTILGKDKEQTYLILFQNDKERRATGGFLTAYAIFTVNKGKIKIVKSDDIYTLDASIAVHPKAPKEILTFHKGVSSFYIRDSNLSPDLVSSIALFESLYQKSGSKVKYDGIIAIDSKVLVDMLRIFGDTQADGVWFKADNDPRCDCPQVLYQLFDMVDRPVNYVKTNRKGILGNLMYELFHKALGFSPSKYWGTLAETMFKNLNEKHILMNFVDKEIQQSVEKLNYGGRINKAQSDYLHVNNVNFAGAKSNLFVNESFDSKTKFNGGVGERELTIDFRNPYPASDCNLERGGLCLNATLRNWIRVYVPKGSKLVDFQGSRMDVKTYDDLDKTVFEGFLTVDPMGKATVIVKYTLPISITSKDYSLLVQKQPGTDGQKLKVTVDGRKLYDGVLDKDMKIEK